MLCRSRRASSRTRHAVRRDQGGSTANARSAARALPSGWRTIPEGCRSCDSESDAWPFRKDGERTRPCIEYGMQCCVAPVGASLKAPASARGAARRTGSRTAMRAPGFPCAFDGSRCRRYRHAPRRAFRRMHRAGSAGFTGQGRPLPLSGRNRRARFCRKARQARRGRSGIGASVGNAPGRNGDPVGLHRRSGNFGFAGKPGHMRLSGIG